jgi:hypothetical protein
MPNLSDSDIVKAIAKIQHEHGWDFGMAPNGATLEDLVRLSKKLTAAFPGLSPKRTAALPLSGQ